MSGKRSENPSALSLKHKMAQLFVMGFDGLTAPDWVVHAIEDSLLGGVILFDQNLTKTKAKNIESPQQLTALTAQLQHVCTESGCEVPLLISIDCEGGRVNRLKPHAGFLDLPSAYDVAHMSAADQITHFHSMVAQLVKCGINYNFTPVVDLAINPDNPIIAGYQRSFGATAETVIGVATRCVEAHIEQHIACSLKHFPGHGSSTQDSHLGFVDITGLWQLQELQPFATLAARFPHPLLTVMTAHVMDKNVDAQYPASLSPAFNQHILREQCGFSGVIISDDLQMQAITDHYALVDACVLAFKAGSSQIIVGNQLGNLLDYRQFIDDVWFELSQLTGHADWIDSAFTRARLLRKACAKDV